MNESENATGVTLSREELYEQVWTTPMIRLSPQFGLSDVGLAKVCKKHCIPRPPRGHWARLQHGKSSPRAPLPKLLDNALDTIVFDQHQMELSRRLIEGGGVLPEARFPVTVSSTLSDPHKLVAATLAALRRAKPCDCGRSHPGYGEHLDVFVSSGAVDRAMRILDALIKTLEAHGCAVRFVETYRRIQTVAEVGGEVIPFSVREAVRRIGGESATGRLTLQVDSSVGRGFNCRWMDRKNQRLEDLLPDLIEELHRIAANLAVQREEREAAQRLHDEQERVRAEKQRLLQEEQQYLAGFLRDVDDWHRSQRIRAYIADAVRRVEDAHGPLPGDHDFYEWARWARHQADVLDPLIDETVPEAGEQ